MFWVSFAGASLWGASASSASLPEAISWVSTEMSYPQGSITVSDGIDRLFATTGFADNGEVPFHAGALPIRERPALPGLGVEAHGYDIAV